MKTGIVFFALFQISFFSVCFAETPTDIDIVHTSIEDLLNIEVTSVSRRPESGFRAPAAIYVLSGDMIRRSGALTIPEALRLVPGVAVSRIDASKWAVSIRGFNSRTVSKLLVLVDGRNIYNQLYSGVFWEAQDVLLDDVERIEVIRGPGGTLWGANAVNGVINIITKSAANTQGGFVRGGGGNENQAFGHVRQGWQPAEDVYVRTYAKYLSRDDGYLADKEPQDRYDMFRTGFRSDYKRSEDSTVTVQGDYYAGGAGEPFGDAGQEVDLSGGNLLGRYSWTNDEIVSEFQSYVDYYRYDSLQLVEDRFTFDAELDQRWQYHVKHSLYWSFNYRVTGDEILDGPLLGVDPTSRTDSLATASIQEEYYIIPDTLHFIIGTKVGYNDYTGIEAQPNVRLAYTPSERHTFWGAVSRAVRTPSRFEDDLTTTNNIATGNNDFKSEELLAYELGYKVQASSKLTIGIASFVYDQERLVTVDNGIINNNLHGDAYGGELTVNYFPIEWLRFSGSYSYLQLDLKLDADGTDVSRPARENGSDPQNQFVITTAIDLAEKWELDFGIRYADRLSSLNVPSYFSAHSRIGYRITKDIQLALVAQNLFDEHHFEQSTSQATQVERSIYGNLIVKY